jgi:hypothetical protein
MSHLIEVWEALLKEATSPDYDEMQDAMFKVGLVLERHNALKKLNQDLYEEHLPRELLRLVLDDKRQMDVVDMLVALTKARKEDADTFLYTLGKVKPELMIHAVLQLIKQQGQKWNIEGAYEACVALDNALRVGGEKIESAIRANDPSEQLDIWSDHLDESLADKADRVLEKIENLLGKSS